LLTINCDLVSSILGQFLKEETEKIGVTKTVLGLSGGVDSAVVACLLIRALGPQNVGALIMPYRESNPDSQKHAELLAGQLGIQAEVHDISPMVDAFFKNDKNASVLRKGNYRWSSFKLVFLNFIFNIFDCFCRITKVQQNFVRISQIN